MTVVTDCTEHPGCVVIESAGWPDVAGSWSSHFEKDVPPEARLNPDDPAQATVEDRRDGKAPGATLNRRTPTAAEAKRLNGRQDGVG